MGAILAMDLGIRLGLASGAAGSKPIVRTILLKQTSEHRSVAFSNLIAFLNVTLRRERPALIVKEELLPLQAFKHLGNAEATVRLSTGLHAIVEGMAQRYAIRCESVADSTVRKHFIGQGRMGSREATKAAVIARARLLKYVPKDCADADKADACAVWDWACATLARSPNRKLHLFGEVA